MVDHAKSVNESFTIAGQVTPEQLAQASQEGFQSVLNIRSAQEPGFLEDERQHAEALGLEYAHAPLQVDEVTIDQLSHILEELDQLPKPTLIHCAGGMRASAIALLSIAQQEGLTAAQAIEKAQALGYDYHLNPKLKQFFESYIANYTPTISR